MMTALGCGFGLALWWAVLCAWLPVGPALVAATAGCTLSFALLGAGIGWLHVLAPYLRARAHARDCERGVVARCDDCGRWLCTRCQQHFYAGDGDGDGEEEED